MMEESNKAMQDGATRERERDNELQLKAVNTETDRRTKHRRREVRHAAWN